MRYSQLCADDDS